MRIIDHIKRLRADIERTEVVTNQKRTKELFHRPSLLDDSYLKRSTVLIAHELQAFKN